MKSFESFLAVEHYKSECRKRAAKKRRADRQFTREQQNQNKRIKICIVFGVVAVWAIASTLMAVQFYNNTAEVPLSIEQPAPSQVVKERVEPVVPEVQEPAYTPEDLEVLALIIYQEAGGDACSDETRRMVGTVVLNRVADDRYPNSIVEVATQYRQYGRLYWTGLKWPERATLPQEAHAVARAYETAEQLLNGDRALPSDVIFQAEFIQGTEVVAHQDGFYFCR